MTHTVDVLEDETHRCTVATTIVQTAAHGWSASTDQPYLNGADCLTGKQQVSTLILHDQSLICSCVFAEMLPVSNTVLHKRPLPQQNYGGGTFTCHRDAQPPCASLKYWERTWQMESREIKLAEMLLETSRPKEEAASRRECRGTAESPSIWH